MMLNGAVFWTIHFLLSETNSLRSRTWIGTHTRISMTENDVNCERNKVFSGFHAEFEHGIYSWAQNTLLICWQHTAQERTYRIIELRLLKIREKDFSISWRLKLKFIHLRVNKWIIWPQNRRFVAFIYVVFSLFSPNSFLLRNPSNASANQANQTCTRAQKRGIDQGPSTSIITDRFSSEFE